MVWQQCTSGPQEPAACEQNSPTYCWFKNKRKRIKQRKKAEAPAQFLAHPPTLPPCLHNQTALTAGISHFWSSGTCLGTLLFPIRCAYQMNTQIRSYHFSGSRQQATIHTGVLYTIHGLTASIIMRKQSGPT